MHYVDVDLGFFDDQRQLAELAANGTVSKDNFHFTPGLATEDRFKLNNLSFAGPVIMGVGGECGYDFRPFKF